MTTKETKKQIVNKAVFQNNFAGQVSVCVERCKANQIDDAESWNDLDEEQSSLVLNPVNSGKDS